jgi:hypothetical protein
VEPQELDERVRAAEEEAGRLKRAVPRITLLNEPLRHHEADGSLPAEAARGPGKDRQDGV